MNVTLDELRSYARCGKYYQAYKDPSTEVQLYNPMSPDVSLYYGLWRWLCYELLVSRAMPTEVAMLSKAKEIQRHLVSKGRIVLFSDMNQIVSACLFLRNILVNVIQSGKKIESLCLNKAFTINKVEVSYYEFLRTSDTIYMFNLYSSVAEFFESVDLALMLTDNAANLPQWIKLISVDDDGMSIKDYQTKRNFDPETSYGYISSLTLGIAKKIYIPIYNCKNYNCSYYMDCTSNRKIVK